MVKVEEDLSITNFVLFIGQISFPLLFKIISIFASLVPWQISVDNCKIFKHSYKYTFLLTSLVPELLPGNKFTLLLLLGILKMISLPTLNSLLIFIK